ncbi:hypothetical protein, partial [Duganella sp. Root1480D1]|uniref:hypothetical protein n=1 Tax=Duganella sp. Root1480D1 TaxID=1736471 RepID=UPI001E31A3A0
NCHHFSETLQISAVIFERFAFRIGRYGIIQGRLSDSLKSSEALDCGKERKLLPDLPRLCLPAAALESREAKWYLNHIGK